MPRMPSSITVFITMFILDFLATSLKVFLASVQAMQGIKKEYPGLNLRQLML